MVRARTFLALVTVAATPLNVTELLAGVALKPEPVIVTLTPALPALGLKLDTEGGTTKLLPLVPVLPSTDTAMGPVTAAVGTVAVKLVAEAAVTVAETPLNVTELLARVDGSKPDPVIVTLTPALPDAGVKPDTTVVTEKIGPR